MEGINVELPQKNYHKQRAIERTTATKSYFGRRNADFDKSNCAIYCINRILKNDLETDPNHFLINKAFMMCTDHSFVSGSRF